MKKKDKTEDKAEASVEEKPAKEKKAKKSKGLTAEKLGKLGKREMRLASKFGKLLIDETDPKRSNLLKDAKEGLDKAAAAILLLSK
jgi:hypothetical protein